MPGTVADRKCGGENTIDPNLGPGSLVQNLDVAKEASPQFHARQGIHQERPGQRIRDLLIVHKHKCTGVPERPQAGQGSRNPANAMTGAPTRHKTTLVGMNQVREEGKQPIRQNLCVYLELCINKRNRAIGGATGRRTGRLVKNHDHGKIELG
mgnify:CR=1 FL=1